MRIRRSLRRSTNAERTSVTVWASDFGMWLRGETRLPENAFRLQTKPPRFAKGLRVLPITLGPDLLGEVGIDTGFVIPNRRLPCRAHRHVVERATRQCTDDR